MTATAPPAITITDTASTNGWDTVFAVHIGDVNRAIVTAGSSPRRFHAVDLPDGYAASGTFGAWQITPGGDGDLIWMRIPIQDVVVTGPDGAAPKAGGAAVIEVRLDFLHQAEHAVTTNSPTAKSPKLSLRLRTTPLAPGDKVASLNRIDYDGAALIGLNDIALRALLEGWFNAHLKDFEHVFATVDLNRTADKGAFQWLQATDVAYAYSDLGTSGDGALAVLCMTEGRSSKGLVQQLAASAIPPGQRAGFLISKQRLLEKLLLPCMPKMFSGSSAQDYKLSDTGDSIVNAADKLAFKVVHDSKTHDATLSSVTLSIEGQQIQLSATTRTEASPGIYACCQTQSFMGINLVNKKDGTQTLSFDDLRPAITNNWTETSAGIQILEKLLGIAALFAALAALVTGGATLAIAAIILGVIAGITDVTVTMIEAAHKGDAPSITSMLLDTTAPIKWADSKDFLLTSAGLNDSLQLGGNLMLAGAIPHSTA